MTNNEIVNKEPEFTLKERAYIDVLLKQYEHLRAEITQCIYLQHAAILGLYTFLGLFVVALVREVLIILMKEGTTQEIIFFNLDKLDPDTIPFFVFTLILAQIIVNGFGSLFMKEQARNRRACSFLKAIEYLISKELGRIGIYWENFLTSDLMNTKINLIEYFKFDSPINRQYYKNRLLSVGVPIWLPNFLITFAIGSIGWALYGKIGLAILVGVLLFITIALPFYTVILYFLKLKYQKHCYLLTFLFLFVMSLISCFRSEERNLVYPISFIISLAVTVFWASMIMYKSFSSLKSEEVPERNDVLKWLKKEQEITVKRVVLEGCLGDWAKKSYIKNLAEKARGGQIELYCVDVRDMGKDEDEIRNLINSVSSIEFINKESNPCTYDSIENIDFVFIVTPHKFHCKTAEHWLEKGKLRDNGKIFIEKPLDSSTENIKNLKRNHKDLDDKTIAIDHYIPKIYCFLRMLEKKKEKLGKLKKMKFNILEGYPIPESRKKTLDEGLILDFFPHILAISTKVMKALDSTFTLDANDFKICDVKTGKYVSAPIKGETFGKIILKTGNIQIDSCVGKIGVSPEKKMTIVFENGSTVADFESEQFSIKIGPNEVYRDSLQTRPTSILLDLIINDKLSGAKDKFLSFNEGFEIVKIISKIISKIEEKKTIPIEYELSKSLDEVTKKLEN